MCFPFHIWIPVIFSCYFVLAEGTAVKGPASKKQRQEKYRNRKEKASQHTFTHQLLASTLKVLWNKTTMIPFVKCYIRIFVCLHLEQMLTGLSLLRLPSRATVETWLVLTLAVMGSTWHHVPMTALSESGAPKTSWSGNTSVSERMWNWITPY